MKSIYIIVIGAILALLFQNCSNTLQSNEVNEVISPVESSNGRKLAFTSGSTASAPVLSGQPATAVEVTFSPGLSGVHSDCVSSNPRSQACTTAAHRLCGSKGYRTGFGPVEFSGNRAWVLCLPDTVASISQIPYEQLRSFHPYCSGVSSTFSYACFSAVNRFCRSVGNIGGAGIVEANSSGAFGVCLKSRTSRESASWHALQNLDSDCSSATPTSPACFTAVNRYCSQLGYSSGFGLNEYQPLHAEFICFQNSNRNRELFIDTLSFLRPSNTVESRTGPNPGGHIISFFTDIVNQRILYTKFGDPSKWMLFKWDSDYISMPVDTTVPEYVPGTDTTTGRTLTSVTSNSYWLKRKMRVGESLYVPSIQKVYSPECTLLRTQSFPYVTRIKSFSPRVDLGGDLGVKSVIVVEYTYFQDTDPANPTYNSEEEVYAGAADPDISADGVVSARTGVGLTSWVLLDRNRRIASKDGVLMNMRFNLQNAASSVQPSIAGSCAEGLIP